MRSNRRQLIVVTLVLLCCVALSGVAFAGEEEKGESKLKAQPFVMPYIVVLFCIGGGMFLVCLSSKRRDRPKDAAFKDDGSALIEQKKQVPVVLMGMRDIKVDKMLGKPKVKRRGDQIYAEMAQAGQLPDEEAAKVHAIYEHPAGRYEIVYLDRRVVEIKKQPEPKPEE